MASSLIGALRVTLGLDTANFEAGSKRARGQAKSTAASIQKSLSGIKLAAGALAGGFIATELIQAGKRALEYASSLGEVSQQLGVTTRDLQVYRFAASQVGISQAEMDTGLQRLSRTIGQAEDDNKKAVKTFRDLKVSIKDANGQVLSAGEVLPRIADAFTTIKTPAEKARVAFDLFGKSGQKYIPLLNEGSAGINALADAAERAGVVLSDEQIQRADETADKLDAVKQVLEANIAVAVSDNADAILALANALGMVVINAGKAAQAYSNFAGLRAFNSSNPDAMAAGAEALTSTASGRRALLLDLDEKLKRNIEDRAKNRGARTSLPLGLGEITREATAEDIARLDREFKNLNRQRNAVLSIDRSASGPGSSPPPLTAGALPTVAGGGAKTKRDDSARNAAQYADEIAQLDLEIRDAQAEASGNAAARAEVERMRVGAERDAALRQIALDDDLSATQRETLIAKQQQLASERLRVLAIDEARRIEDESFQLDSAANQNQQDLLRSQLGLARTAKARLAIEDHILNLIHDQEASQLLKTIADKTSSDAARAEAEARLEVLARIKLNEARENKQRNLSPLEEYLDSIPKSADEINEALERVQVDGLEGLNEGIIDAITGAKSLGDVFSDVADQIIRDLLRIAIQQAIIKPLTAMLEGGGGLGGLFGGPGTSTPGYGGGKTTGDKGASFPGFATGGSFKVGGAPGVDRNLIAFRATRGEMVDIRRPGNDNGGRGGNKFYLSGNLLTPEFWQQIEAMDAQAAQRGAGLALTSAAAQRRNALGFD